MAARCCICHFMLGYFVIFISRDAQSANHWIVTEDGKIQAQMDSVFNMRRPYDLMSLLKQEERRAELEDMKHQMQKFRNERSIIGSSDKEFEEQIHKTEDECVKAGQPLSEFDLFISTVLPLETKGISVDQHVDFSRRVSTIPHIPDCTRFVPLDFSMHAFEHFQSMQNRENLTGAPELGLKSAIVHRDNLDDYGDLVYEALAKNKTSWVLYNMAAFYWRIKGDAYQMVECVRRALHFSPRTYKDVALLSLANVLHRARYSAEAAIVAHAGLHLSPSLYVHHFTLGNIYAVMGEFAAAAGFYQTTAWMQPEFLTAQQRAHAVLCSEKIRIAREQRNIVDDNHVVSENPLFDLWHMENEKMLSEQAPLNVRVDQQVAYKFYKMQEVAYGEGNTCDMREVQGRQVLDCSWKRRSSVTSDTDFLASWSNKGKQHDGLSVNYMQPVKLPTYSARKTYSAEVLSTLRHKETDWPDKEECEIFVKKVPQWNEFPTVFLPPENKGFEVKALLAEAQDLGPNVEHPLPWYPPNCVALADIPESRQSYDHIQAIKDRVKTVPKVPDTSLREMLLSYVKNADVTDEEVGQRILTALKKKTGPNWILYNLAGLYWRVIGNSFQSIECIRRALYYVPQQYADVPLVNMASVLYRLSRPEESVILLHDALAVNPFEPETHFLLANLYFAKSNLTGAAHHYEECLNQAPTHTEAFSLLRAVKCQLKFDRQAQSAPIEMGTTQSSGSSICNQGNKGYENPVIRCRKQENGRENCVVTPVDQPCSCQPIAAPQGHCQNPPPCVHKGCADKGETPSGMWVVPHPSFEVGPNDDVDQKFEEVGKYLKQKAMCNGPDCDKLVLQNLNQQHPHMRLELINGMLHQQLIFINPPTDLDVAPHECIVFNTGQRTAGCDREEFREFFISNEPNTLINVNVLSTDAKGNSRETVANGKTDAEEENTLDLVELSAPCTGPGCSERIYSDYEIITQNMDPMRHVKNFKKTKLPSWNECRRNYKQIDYTAFTNTWTVVGSMEITELLTITHGLEEGDQPYCEYDGRVDIDLLDGVMHSEVLIYPPEPSAMKSLLYLKYIQEQQWAIPARLAVALRKKPVSWAAVHVATLYWRFLGRPKEAIDCVRLAYSLSQYHSKSQAMLNLANILFGSGRLDEALRAAELGIKYSINNTAATIYFTIGNLLAYQQDFARAIRFYESAIQLEPALMMAQQRLTTLQCDRVLSNPHKYKKPGDL